MSPLVTQLSWTNHLLIMGETTEDAVKREVYEETGVAYEIDHLAVIHENFFNEN